MANHYSILLLEDDEAQVDLIRGYLQMHLDCTVDWAFNGKEFWAMLEQKKYSIIFMDYILPDTNGLETLQALARCGSRTPVVMITGEGNERVAAKSIQAGAFDYLVKGEYPLNRLVPLIERAVAAQKLQEAVDESMEKIRYQSTLLDNMRDAVVVWDLDGKITFWNPAAYLLFGLKPEEVIGKSATAVYLNAFNPPIRLPQPGDSGGLEVERQYVSKQGQTRWISSRVSILRDEEHVSRLMGYIDVSRDITRRKREQQALRESEARYRAIVEDHQTEHICRSLSDTTLTFVNEAYCKYFQRPREELIGTPFLDFVLDEDREILQSRLRSLCRENMVFTCEYRVCLPNGEIRWNESTHRAIFDDLGNYIEFQSVGHDITPRKEMEAQVQRSQMHLVQSARLSSIGQLAAGIAHQIYNPLTTVIGESQILMHEYKNDPAARESLDAIVQAGWRSQQVVQKLLEYSQPSVATRRLVSINETIMQAVDLVGINAPGSSITLSLELSDQLAPVLFNPHQLEDLWVNLMLLAQSAAQDGDRRHVGVRSGENESGEVQVEIWYDGDPIPASQISTIFEPSLEPVGGRGSGMELSICREIVRQNNGTINFKSDDNSTRVQVILPKEG